MSVLRNPKAPATRRFRPHEPAVYPRAVVVLAVMALCFGALALDSCRASAESSITASGADGALKAFAVALSDDGEVLEASWDGGYGTDVPAAFDEEVMDSSIYGAYASADGQTVGLVIGGDADAVSQMVCESMQGKGWVCIESGSSAITTCAKEGGVYSWCAFTCVETAGSTSVVFTLREGGEDG